MDRGKALSRCIKLAIAAVLLAALYWHCDGQRVAAALRGLDAGYLAAAMSLFVPQTVVSAWRWKRLAAPLCSISLGEAIRQTLAASAWNLIAPSKLGDFTKVAMLPADVASRRHALTLVVCEKIGDVAALALLWTVASAFPVGGYLVVGVMMLALPGECSRNAQTRAGVRHFSQALRRSAVPSLLLWSLHLVQIHLMLLAAGVLVGIDVSAARVPAAIFAGLAPVSLWGIGTRDAALVWLFSDVAAPATMAAVGLLTATRYLVPGAVGIVFAVKHAAQVPMAGETPFAPRATVIH